MLSFVPVGLVETVGDMLLSWSFLLLLEQVTWWRNGRALDLQLGLSELLYFAGDPVFQPSWNAAAQ